MRRRPAAAPAAPLTDEEGELFEEDLDDEELKQLGPFEYELKEPPGPARRARASPPPLLSGPGGGQGPAQQRRAADGRGAGGRGPGGSATLRQGREAGAELDQGERNALDDAVEGLRGARDEGRVAELLQERTGRAARGGQAGSSAAAADGRGAQALLAARAIERVPAEKQGRSQPKEGTFERALLDRLTGRGGRGRRVEGLRSDSEEDEASEPELGLGLRAARVKYDHFRALAKRKPGHLLQTGLDQLRKQFPAGAPAGELPACCVQFLDVVFFVEHTPKSLGAHEVRLLRTIATAIDHFLTGSTLEGLDLLMQELKARTMAIKDGGWDAAQWLAQAPLGAEPSAASCDEEVTARRVAHAELQRVEPRQKLREKRARF